MSTGTPPAVSRGRPTRSCRWRRAPSVCDCLRGTITFSPASGRRGGRYGPIEIGDYFNYYHANPVRIEEGKTREVRIETITRLSMLEQDETIPAFRGVRGTIAAADGRPVSGVRVFAYRQPEMTGTPDFFSAPSDTDGAFELRLPTGTFYLLARESFGGPATTGEHYGKYGGRSDHAVDLSDEQWTYEVKIDVAIQP